MFFRALEKMNVSGTCSSRFCILQKQLIADVKKIISIIKAVTPLHKCLINGICYILEPLEKEMKRDQNLPESFLPFIQLGLKIPKQNNTEYFAEL